MSVVEAAELVAQHPLVADVQIAGGGLRVRPTEAATTTGPAPGPLVQDYLDHWAELYDYVYESGTPTADDLDLSGWRASDTGRPFPVEHMRDWIDRTVDVVLRHRPRHILELGCGTGLLLRRLCGHVDGYVGTDVSRVAVDRLAAADLPGVRMVVAGAHETSTPAVRHALADGAGPWARPDLVLLNSVTQHFPHGDYLRAVLLDVLALVADGGVVVVGDVRHAALLGAHSLWIERTADPQADPDDLALRAAARAAREPELLVDPRFMLDAAAASDREVAVQLLPRTMAAESELTRYRYDAVFRVGVPVPGAAPAWIGWLDLPGPDRCAALVALMASGPAAVRAIPNGLLHPAPGAVTPSTLARVLGGVDASTLLDTDDPALLRVVGPDEQAWSPVSASPLPRAELVHEPMAGFLRRRLPELLHDHLHRHGATDDIHITVAGPAE